VIVKLKKIFILSLMLIAIYNISANEKNIDPVKSTDSFSFSINDKNFEGSSRTAYDEPSTTTNQQHSKNMLGVGIAGVSILGVSTLTFWLGLGLFLGGMNWAEGLSYSVWTTQKSTQKYGAETRGTAFSGLAFVVIGFLLFWPGLALTIVGFAVSAHYKNKDNKVSFLADFDNKGKYYSMGVKILLN
jgi:hypothetical protein